LKAFHPEAVKDQEDMSKIEKALERAKTLREAGTQETHGQTPAQIFSVEEEKPVYTKTRVISLDSSHCEKHRVMTFLDDPGIMDHYNLLRTQVLQRTRPKGHNAIMITSVLDGEGKTVTAINLAFSIAKEVKQTVLLVDTDLRNPKIHHYLGCDTQKGLSDYLQGDVSLSELLINPGLDKMVVLPAGRPYSGSTEILGSPKMEKLVVEMKRRYPQRYVIFDCAPVLTVSDALVFSSYVDGVILVVEAGRTSKDQIRMAVERLEGHNIVGLVMNKAEGAHGGYYY
jgi:exopolysaccharide/PEP-CTERM locus tyrosine autokinase